MGYSNRFKASWARAQGVFNALRAYDPRFDRNAEGYLVGRHEEGSELRLRNAFEMRDPKDEDWIWIMTGHMHFYVLSREDVTITVEKRK